MCRIHVQAEQGISLHKDRTVVKKSVKLTKKCNGKEEINHSPLKLCRSTKRTRMNECSRETVSRTHREIHDYMRLYF